MTEDWSRSLDNRVSAMAVAVDLSKAFDSINLLLAKLEAYGLSQSAMKLMSSYLLGRKQRVCLHGVCSSYSELRAGLPQGSLLGPPLFNIFINDLNYAVPDVSLRLYADDTTLFTSDVSPIALQVVVVSQGLSRLLVRCKLFVDKQCQDASPSDRSLQVRFWLNFEWFWRY